MAAVPGGMAAGERVLVYSHNHHKVASVVVHRPRTPHCALERANQRDVQHQAQSQVCCAVAHLPMRRFQWCSLTDLPQSTHSVS